VSSPSVGAQCDGRVHSGRTKGRDADRNRGRREEGDRDDEKSHQVSRADTKQQAGHHPRQRHSAEESDDDADDRQLHSLPQHHQQDAAPFRAKRHAHPDVVSALGDEIRWWIVFTIAPAELPVESPTGIAERCWDSGYTVRVPADGRPEELIVVDPFGRPIALIRRTSEYTLGAEAVG